MTNKSFVPPAEKVHEVPQEDMPPDVYKVLMLDDDESFAATLKDYLSTLNYQITHVKNGAEGVKHIMATDFDVILCDMMMPTLPGDMFYLAVERTKPHLCKRFIFMTGYQGDPKIDGFIRKVRGLILWKPFEIHSLTEALQTILKKTQPSKP